MATPRELPPGIAATVLALKLPGAFRPLFHLEHMMFGSGSWPAQIQTPQFRIV